MGARQLRLFVVPHDGAQKFIDQSLAAGEEVFQLPSTPDHSIIGLTAPQSAKVEVKEAKEVKEEKPASKGASK